MHRDFRFVLPVVLILLGLVSVYSYIQTRTSGPVAIAPEISAIQVEKQGVLGALDVRPVLLGTEVSVAGKSVKIIQESTGGETNQNLIYMVRVEGVVEFELVLVGLDGSRLIGQVLEQGGENRVVRFEFNNILAPYLLEYTDKQTGQKAVWYAER